MNISDAVAARKLYKNFEHVIPYYELSYDRLTRDLIHMPEDNGFLVEGELWLYTMIGNEYVCWHRAPPHSGWQVVIRSRTNNDAFLIMNDFDGKFYCSYSTLTLEDEVLIPLIL